MTVTAPLAPTALGHRPTPFPATAETSSIRPLSHAGWRSPRTHLTWETSSPMTAFCSLYLASCCHRQCCPPFNLNLVSRHGTPLLLRRDGMESTPRTCPVNALLGMPVELACHPFPVCNPLPLFQPAERFGWEAATAVKELGQQAEAQPPRLVQHDAWGGRIDAGKAPGHGEGCKCGSVL